MISTQGAISLIRGGATGGKSPPKGFKKGKIRKYGIFLWFKSDVVFIYNSRNQYETKISLKDKIQDKVATFTSSTSKVLIGFDNAKITNLYKKNKSHDANVVISSKIYYYDNICYKNSTRWSDLLPTIVTREEFLLLAVY